MIKAFLRDLKRRQVYKVALTYAAVAWMVLEVADLVFPLFELPDWSLRLVLIICALGFPIAMVLAWVFDLTPDGVVVTEPAPEEKDQRHLSGGQIIQIGLIAILVTIVGYLYIDRLSLKEQQDPATQVAADADDRSIAVLPFVNMSPDAGNEYFSDGVSEELLNALANVRGLRVAARTSSFFFKGSNEGVTQIGEKLGVATLLEGSVRKSGIAVRITAQLINTKNGFHLWSKTYDGTLDDIFSLQNDIASQVVQAITPVLLIDTDRTQQLPTKSVTAYNHYLKGRAFLGQTDDNVSLDSAQAEFDLAIKDDAGYVEAYAGLCETELARYTHHRQKQAFTAAEQACHRALTREKYEAQSWEVHIALGSLYREAGEHAKSLSELSHANRIRPDSAELFQQRGLTYAASGRAADAEVAFKRALKIDPANWGSYLKLGSFYYDQRRYTEAISQFDRILEIVPEHTSALIGLGSTLYMQGKEGEAEVTWQKAEVQAQDKDAGSLGIIFGNLGLGHYYKGEFEKAVAMQLKAANLIGEDHKVWGRLAESYRGNGEHAKAKESYITAIELAEKELTRNPNHWETLGLLGLYHAFAGSKQTALKYKQKMLVQKGSVSTAHYFASLINWICGDTDGAFAELDAAMASGFSAKLIEMDPDLKSLRQADPKRFQDIIDKT
ncbi:MAG: tetratricopeptide repeat protein [Pseudomonadales bacterium]